jgi:tripartite-type tricarboxylate transporter receptor subunit TctC
VLFRTATAQELSRKAVRIVVAFVAGGADDFHGRLIAQKLTELLGQQVIVENRGGAGGFVGWEYVAKGGARRLHAAARRRLADHGAEPAAESAVRRAARFHADIADLDVRAGAGRAPVGAGEIGEGADRARKAQPGKLNYASSGAGATPHLSAELFKSMAKVDIVHIPYKGSTPGLRGFDGGDRSTCISA